MIPRRKLTVPLYGVAVMLFLTEQEYCRVAGGRPEDLDGADACVVSLWADKARPVVGVVFNGPAVADASTIAHEAVHAAWRTLDIVGARVDSDNHEALAYLVGWFVTEITKFVDAYRAAESSEAPTQ